MRKKIEKAIHQSSDIVRQSMNLSESIERAVRVIVSCIQGGNKIVVFGNGGSATDAQHIAGEFIGRFLEDRESYPAIALTGDSAVVTALANDFGYETVFSRQCEGLVVRGDVAIGLTSSNSRNVFLGLSVSKQKGASTIGFLGNKADVIKQAVDIPIIVPSTHTPHIQEVHRVIYHIICDLAEKELMKKRYV